MTAPKNPFAAKLTATAAPFEKQLASEGLAPIENTHAPASQSVDTSSPEQFVLAGANAEAFRDCIDNPGFPQRDREILYAFLEHDCKVEETAKAVKCSTAKVTTALANAKHLMLHPEEMPPSPEEAADEMLDDAVITEPVASGALFEDVENSIERIAKIGHRVVMHYENQPVLFGKDVKTLESVARTLVLLRRSEAEYHRDGKPNADNNTLHRLAGSGSMRRGK